MMSSEEANVPKAPQELIDALKENRAIAIVGSGLSIAAGGPSWQDLLLGVAAEAQETKPEWMEDIKPAIQAIVNHQYGSPDVLMCVFYN